MKFEIIVTSRFKKDLKVILKRGYDISKLEAVIEVLQQGNALEAKNHDHNLSGNYFGFRECHIEPDWLLVYKIEENMLLLTLVRTGTHSDLF